MERRAWLDSEVELLRKSASESFLKDLATELDRPVKMVRWKLNQLGLKAKDARTGNTGRPVSIWTAERLEHLRRLAPTMSAAHIAVGLGVTEKQVRTALFEHGIEGRGVSRKQTPEEVKARTAPLKGRIKVDRKASRTCSRCGEEKLVFQYPSESTVESLLCEECRKKARAERHAALTPEERRRMNLQQRTNRHGLSRETYTALLEAQSYSCAVCLTPFSETRSPAIDHDHKHCSGVSGCAQCIRGLVCTRCNTAVGWAETFHASPEYLEAIAAYLSKADLL